MAGKFFFSIFFISVCIVSGCVVDTQTNSYLPQLSGDNLAGDTVITWSGYNKQQVAHHHTDESCRTIIDEKVYDLTTYIHQHPGGVKRIESLCGSDGTFVFASEHGGKYRPAQALEVLQIGILDTTD